MKYLPIYLLILIFHSINLSAQQAHINLDWDPQKNKENLVPFSANVISPEVYDDHTVVFRLESARCFQGIVDGNHVGR